MNDETKTAEQIRALFYDRTPEEVAEMIKELMVLMSYYRCAILEVETKFKVLSEQFSLSRERNPIENINTRLKSYESIRRKLIKRGIPISPKTIEKELSDIAGIRIICSYIDDIYMLSRALLSQDDITLIEIKDYIKEPKPNGYRSLHLIIEIPIYLANEKRPVRAEVQLRTIAMESWANIEHQLRYKKELTPEVAEFMDRELGECAEMSHALDLKMQSLREISEK